MSDADGSARRDDESVNEDEEGDDTKISEEESAIQREINGRKLFLATKEGNIEEALQWVSFHGERTSSEGGWTTMQYAAYYGDLRLVQALLEDGAGGWYLEQLRRDEIRRQLQSKMDSETDRLDDEALRMLVMSKSTSEEGGGALLPVDSMVFVQSPLLWASIKGHLACCWMLIAHGYRVDDQDKDGNTSLHLAASNRHTSIVELLLACGASVDIKNKHKNAVLDMATDPTTRSMIKQASTPQEASIMRDRHMEKYHSFVARVQSALKLEVSTLGSMEEEGESAKALQDLIETAMGAMGGWEPGVVDQLKRKKAVVESQQRIRELIRYVESVAPVTSQKHFTQYVNKLKARVNQASKESFPLSQELVETGKKLVARSFEEYWLHHVTGKLSKRVEAMEVRLPTLPASFTELAYESVEEEQPSSSRRPSSAALDGGKNGTAADVDDGVDDDVPTPEVSERSVEFDTALDALVAPHQALLLDLDAHIERSQAATVSTRFLDNSRALANRLHSRQRLLESCKHVPNYKLPPQSSDLEGLSKKQLNSFLSKYWADRDNGHIDLTVAEEPTWVSSQALRDLRDYLSNLAVNLDEAQYLCPQDESIIEFARKIQDMMTLDAAVLTERDEAEREKGMAAAIKAAKKAAKQQRRGSETKK